MDEHRKTRRRHSAPFKLEVLAACREPGASVAGVALAFGLNANLVRQWLRGRGVKRADDIAIASQAPALPRAAAQEFVPLAFPATLPSPQPESTSPAADIRIEVHRGALHVNVSWPPSAAAECAGWLRELLR